MSMEIYADEKMDRAYVGNGRGPYTVLDRDGTTSESYTVHGAELVFGLDGAAYEDGYADGLRDGHDKGHEEGYRRGREDEREEADADEAARRRLAARCLPYRPMRLTVSALHIGETAA